MVPSSWPAVASGALLAVLAAQSPAPADPLAFFGSLPITAADRQRADRGEALVKNLPARDADVAVMALSHTSATGERLTAWVRQIARLKAGPQVQGIARFSTPPRIDDLVDLTLDNDDLNDIRRCNPGDCSVRLSASEMTMLRGAAAEAGADWKPAVQRAFRRVILARAESYLDGGSDRALPYHDRRDPVEPAREFQLLLEQTTFLTARVPSLADHLRTYPRSQAAIESFLYWSKEDLGRKPVVAITHVNMVRGTGPGMPDALIVSKQVYASHYMTGALAVTAVAATPDGSARYLVYLNRSRLDVFGGLFGGLVRSVIDRRLRNEAGDVVEAIRRRLESGDP